MNVTNSFFNVQAPPSAAVYVPSTMGVLRSGYAFADFQAARDAIEQAFSVGNWDGYGALPVSDETKRNALGALNQLERAMYAPEITLNPNGTLSFGWETSQGFAQLEIGRTRYSFYVQPYKGSPLLDEGDADNVKPTVGWLLEAMLYPRPSHPVTVSTP
jgi:hypothetical protein